MIFKEGDHVQVKEGFQEIRYEHDPGIVSEMLPCIGQEFTIKHMLSARSCLLENNYWTRSTEWLELIEDPYEEIQVNEKEIMNMF